MQDLLCLAFPIDGAVTIRVTAPVYKADPATGSGLQLEEPETVTESAVVVPSEDSSYTFDDLCTLVHYQTIMLGIILLYLIAKSIVWVTINVTKWIYYNTFYHL